ncbi:hypothetical protein [Streptomyces sp. NK08204]|uniref:hypothetical protein n=1 Tax=Streptomyces sp. NK08204 TaxID=2873260 RepID=UPI001CEC3697|nr:hypothetical protein [Streptomyces sp. NK08204]
MLAPGTVVFGLLYYFGSTYITSYYSFFGILASDLQLSSQSYVARSDDALFLPLWFLFCCGLAVLLAFGLLERWLLRSGRSLRRRVTRGLLGAGTVLTLLGLVVFMGPAWWNNEIIARLQPGLVREFLPTLVVALGTTMGICAVHLRMAHQRRLNAGRPTDRLWLVGGSLFTAMLFLSLFFSMARYAHDAGLAQAQLDARGHYRGRPWVRVYSRQPIAYNLPDISREDLAPDHGPYRYRYEWFVLLAKSNGRYYLVNRSWHPFSNNTVVVLPDDDSVRVDVLGRPS